MYYFHVNNEGEIVYGIGAIKGIGEGTIEAIIKARNQEGPFMELFDLCRRTNIKRLSRRVLEKLIMSGACDCLGLHRAALMNSISGALKAAEQKNKTEAIGQGDMFGVLGKRQGAIIGVAHNCVPTWPPQVVLDGERSTLGFYLTGHPITQYIREIEHYAGSTLLKDIRPTQKNEIVTVAGLVLSPRVIITKRGNRIGFCTLDDRSGKLDVILFTDKLVKYQNLLEKDRILIARGRVSFDDFNGGLKMIACELMDINEAREKYVRGLAISLTDRQIDDQFLRRLRLSLEPYRSGKTLIYIYYRQKYARVRLRLGETWRVTPTDHLLNDLRAFIGNEQIQLEFD